MLSPAGDAITPCYRTAVAHAVLVLAMQCLAALALPSPEVLRAQEPETLVLPKPPERQVQFDGDLNNAASKGRSPEEVQPAVEEIPFKLRIVNENGTSVIGQVRICDASRSVKTMRIFTTRDDGLVVGRLPFPTAGCSLCYLYNNEVFTETLPDGLPVDGEYAFSVKRPAGRRVVVRLVRAGDNQPIGNVNFALSGRTNLFLDLAPTARTDKDGRAEFFLPAETKWAFPRLDGYVRQDADFTVGAADDEEHTLAYGVASKLKLVLRDQATGKPLPNVSLDLMDVVPEVASGRRNPSNPRPTDAAGESMLEGLEPGYTYHMLATSDTYARRFVVTATSAAEGKVPEEIVDILPKVMLKVTITNLPAHAQVRDDLRMGYTLQRTFSGLKDTFEAPVKREGNRAEWSRAFRRDTPIDLKFLKLKHRVPALKREVTEVTLDYSRLVDPPVRLGLQFSTRRVHQTHVGGIIHFQAIENLPDGTSEQMESTAEVKDGFAIIEIPKGGMYLLDDKELKGACLRRGLETVVAFSKGPAKSGETHIIQVIPAGPLRVRVSDPAGKKLEGVAVTARNFSAPASEAVLGLNRLPDNANGDIFESRHVPLGVGDEFMICASQGFRTVIGGPLKPDMLTQPGAYLSLIMEPPRVLRVQVLTADKKPAANTSFHGCLGSRRYGSIPAVTSERLLKTDAKGVLKVELSPDSALPGYPFRLTIKPVEGRGPAVEVPLETKAGGDAAALQKVVMQRFRTVSLLVANTLKRTPVMAEARWVQLNPRGERVEGDKIDVRVFNKRSAIVEMEGVPEGDVTIEFFSSNGLFLFPAGAPVPAVMSESSATTVPVPAGASNVWVEQRHCPVKRIINRPDGTITEATVNYHHEG
ncbi:hypothetical protein DB346_25055 [Verrucomicrobia bacterium LW23]|nr:hypothetical protein DB346_25055 [Verrucomicrobia bacterium LW23]